MVEVPERNEFRGPGRAKRVRGRGDREMFRVEGNWDVEIAFVTAFRLQNRGWKPLTLTAWKAVPRLDALRARRCETGDYSLRLPGYGSGGVSLKVWIGLARQDGLPGIGRFGRLWRLLR